MTEPYLILHKVRGEPVFDIAILIPCSVCQGTQIKQIGIHEGEDCDCNEGLCWIVPTSGHRAYPYSFWPLEDLADVSDINAQGSHLRPIHAKEPPDSWPDHYACNDRPLKEDVYIVKQRAKGLLETLGMVKKVNVERRF